MAVRPWGCRVAEAVIPPSRPRRSPAVTAHRLIVAEAACRIPPSLTPWRRRGRGGRRDQRARPIPSTGQAILRSCPARPGPWRRRGEAGPGSVRVVRVNRGGGARPPSCGPPRPGPRGPM